MAKIIIYGDIDISPLYVSVDGGNEKKVYGKTPYSISLPSGTHHIFATSVTKFERAASSISGGTFLDVANETLQNAANSTIEGELYFGSSDVLLIEVKIKGLKTYIYNKLVPESEANNYIEANAVSNDESGEKNKWVALFLCLFFGVIGAHCFYEGKSGKGVLYLFTLGLFGFGVLIDFFKILFRKS